MIESKIVDIQKAKFPKLMVSDGFVVLFTRPGYGVVVHIGDIDSIRYGPDRTCWMW